MPSCCREASARPTERCCAISASSQSQTVVPSATLPGLVSTPEATSRASTSVVLPPPDGPTSTTLRMAAGLSATGTAPLPWELFDLSAMTSPLPRSIPPFTQTGGGHKGRQTRKRGTRSGAPLRWWGLLHVDVDGLVGDRGQQVVSRVAGVGAAVGLSGTDGDDRRLLDRGAADVIHDHVVALRFELADRVLCVARTARCGVGGRCESEDGRYETASDDGGKSELLHVSTSFFLFIRS